VVGRFASQIAQILMGKDKPTYSPEKDDGDVVVVVNAKGLEFTGRKWDNKVYRWHTGYPGGLKERTAKEQHERDPTEVLRKAVMGMLPKNNQRRAMARKLRIYPGEQHDFEGHPQLVPFEMPPRKLRDKGQVFEAPEGFEPFNPDRYFKKLERMKGKV
jgi:large subunit ribosomal protein L13